MQSITLPQPPDPTTINYINNPLAYNRAVRDWMTTVKGTIEIALNNNFSPAAQIIVAINFTTNTLVTGTTTGTDLSNVVCSIVQALTSRGILTPKTGQ